MNESTLEDDAKEVFCLVFEGMNDEQLQLQIFPIDVLCRSVLLWICSIGIETKLLT